MLIWEGVVVVMVLQRAPSLCTHSTFMINCDVCGVIYFRCTCGPAVAVAMPVPAEALEDVAPVIHAGIKSHTAAGRKRCRSQMVDVDITS